MSVFLFGTRKRNRDARNLSTNALCATCFDKQTPFFSEKLVSFCYLSVRHQIFIWIALSGENIPQNVTAFHVFMFSELYSQNLEVVWFFLKSKPAILKRLSLHFFQHHISRLFFHF